MESIVLDQFVTTNAFYEKKVLSFLALFQSQLGF